MGAKIKSHKREGRSSVRAACGTRLAEGTFGIIVLPRRVLGYIDLSSRRGPRFA